MSDDISKAWKQAFAHPGEKAPVGRAVVCDICDEDWTERKEPGGFLFGSYAYCPNCAVEGLRAIKRTREEGRIVATCGPDESFADFVRRMRGKDAYITVGGPDLLDAMIESLKSGRPGNRRG
jgi:hypothetical protein